MPPACTTPLGAPLGIIPRAAIIGSPSGPCRVPTSFPRVTVPNPPLDGCAFWVCAVGLTQPPPNPASSTNVVAVRFISPPDRVRFQPASAQLSALAHSELCINPEHIAHSSQVGQTGEPG